MDSVEPDVDYQHPQSVLDNVDDLLLLGKELGEALTEWSHQYNNYWSQENIEQNRQSSKSFSQIYFTLSKIVSC